jgi:hypothetical protein
MVQGTPYQTENAVISEVRLDTRNVSGMYTTMLPLSWMQNASRVLCSYTETFIRVGSIVYVKPSAPTCCCPKPSTPSDFTGSFFCPKGPAGSGPYAVQSQTIADKLLVDGNQLTFPYCHSGLDGNDRYCRSLPSFLLNYYIFNARLMCCRWGVDDQVYYTVNCSHAESRSGNDGLSDFGSRDLFGISYPGQCDYFAACGKSRNGLCQSPDYLFSFVGQMGRVVSLDEVKSNAYAWVTFNDGRTAYHIAQADLTLEYRKHSMYGKLGIIVMPMGLVYNN